MLIPVVPFIPYTKVINKKIIYDDVVEIDLREITSLEITHISNISELDLENCLKTILNSNKNIVFYKIKYSTLDKEIEEVVNRYHEIKKQKRSKIKNKVFSFSKR